MQSWDLGHRRGATGGLTASLWSRWNLPSQHKCWPHPEPSMPTQVLASIRPPRAKVPSTNTTATSPEQDPWDPPGSRRGFPHLQRGPCLHSLPLLGGSAHGQEGTR